MQTARARALVEKRVPETSLLIGGHSSFLLSDKADLGHIRAKGGNLERDLLHLQLCCLSKSFP